MHLEPDNSALVLHDGAQVPLRWAGWLFHLDYWSTTAVVDAPQLCAQVLAEADYKRADAALCRHFEIDETTVALPESAFGGKDERGRDISTSMLMPHRVIKPHGLSHSGSRASRTHCATTFGFCRNTAAQRDPTPINAKIPTATHIITSAHKSSNLKTQGMPRHHHPSKE